MRNASRMQINSIQSYPTSASKMLRIKNQFHARRGEIFQEALVGRHSNLFRGFFSRPSTEVVNFMAANSTTSTFAHTH